jgi:hypothetical protein
MKFQYRRGGGFPKNHLCRVFFFVQLLIFIAASCGGGGGDSSPAGAPGAPTGVTAVAGAGQARVSWDNVADATSYNLYYSSAGSDKSWNRNANVASPGFTPLNNGTTYFCGDGGQRRR